MQFKAQHGDYTVVDKYFIAYLKHTKGLNLKSFHHKKKCNLTHYSDHFEYIQISNNNFVQLKLIWCYLTIKTQVFFKSHRFIYYIAVLEVRCQKQAKIKSRPVSSGSSRSPLSCFFLLLNGGGCLNSLVVYPFHFQTLASTSIITASLWLLPSCLSLVRILVIKFSQTI